MSRKPIHLKIEVPVTKRLRWLFSRGRIDILLQPTTLGGIRVVNVLLSGRDHKAEVRDAIPD